MKKITIWFCSSGDDELRGLVRDFSLDLGSPVFLPHVTLLGSVEMEDTFSYQDAVRNIVRDWSPLEVSLGGIGFEDIFWRCFYYRAFPEKDLFQFHHELANGLSGFGARPSEGFMPHLSLAYAKMNILQQQTFLEKHKSMLFPRNLVFDRIKIVHFIPEDVNAWEVMASISLKHI